MTTTLDEMYGISKNGAAPYIYFSHDPQDRHGTDYGYRLLAVNRRQQPEATFAIVGPFTDQDRDRHVADPASWDGERQGIRTFGPPERRECSDCGTTRVVAEFFTAHGEICDDCHRDVEQDRQAPVIDWEPDAIDALRDYSDAIDRLIGGLSAVWSMP